MIKNKRTFKIIILVGAGIAVLGAVIAYLMYNKPHQDISNTKPDIIIGPEELYTAFSENEQAANEKFLGKILQVSGEIVNKETNNNAYTLWLHDALFGVSCSFDSIRYNEYQQYLNGLKIGDSVTVKGTCDGMLSDVVLTRCVPVIE